MAHPLAQYRESKGLSQDEAALELGLSSGTSISNIETGSRDSPIRLGLQIQVWSKGEVQAVDIVSPEDRQLLIEYAAFAKVAA